MHCTTSIQLYWAPVGKEAIIQSTQFQEGKKEDFFCWKASHPYCFVTLLEMGSEDNLEWGQCFLPSLWCFLKNSQVPRVAFWLHWRGYQVLMTCSTRFKFLNHLTDLLVTDWNSHLFLKFNAAVSRFLKPSHGNCILSCCKVPWSQIHFCATVSLMQLCATLHRHMLT